jgi:magnesium-transporting ATPase (P-type)
LIIINRRQLTIAWRCRYHDDRKQLTVTYAVFAGDNILTAVSVAKECGIIAPGEAVVNVTAVPEVKDTPARIFYTSPNGVSTACFLKELASVSLGWDFNHLNAS